MCVSDTVVCKFVIELEDNCHCSVLCYESRNI